MMHLDSIHGSLPDDVVFKFVSLLPVSDVCVLGSCSKFWWEVCGSNSIWFGLSRERWPSLELSDNSMFSDYGSNQQPAVKVWKLFYISRHNEMAQRMSAVTKFVEQCSSSVSLEARDHLKAMMELKSMQLDFKDVELFLFKTELNVMLNLVGLHYCITFLKVPIQCIVDSLQRSRIAERQVSVKWWKLGQWVHGFRLRDESHYRLVSLAGLTTDEHEVLGVLNRGAVYEVMRVQISVAYPRSEPWTCQSSV